MPSFVPLNEVPVASKELFCNHISWFMFEASSIGVFMIPLLPNVVSNAPVMLSYLAIVNWLFTLLDFSILLSGCVIIPTLLLELGLSI